jgi:hypothetical protein
MNVSMPLLAHSGTEDHLVPLPGYTIQFHDNGEKPCTIKTLSGRVAPCENKRLNVGVTYSILHVMLASAFPDIPPLETVDHIYPSDPSNDHVNNLRWMTRSQNSADSWKGRQGIHTSVRQAVDCLAAIPNGVTPDVVVWRCSSYGEAAKVILPTVSKQTPTPKDLETAANRISDASRGLRASAYGWCWRQAPAVAIADDEEWRPFTSGDVTVQVSNYGYVDNIRGVTIGNKTRGMSSRKFNHKGKNVYVHRAVYEAFVRKLEPGEKVIHVQGTPKDEDGCYSNKLRYLDVAGNAVRSSGDLHPAESSEAVLSDSNPMLEGVDPDCEDDKTIVPASFAEALKLYTPPFRRREFNGASFQTYGSLSAMYKNGHIAIFDEHFEDQVNKLTWCFDSSSSGKEGPWYTSIRSVTAPGGTPGVVKNFPVLLDVTNNIDKTGKDISDQKIRLHKFIRFLNNPQVANEDFKIFVTPIDGYTWDCRVENIGLTTTTNFKPPQPVELSADVQEKMGMKFLPKDFFLQAGGNTIATADVNGKKLKKVCHGTDDMVDKLTGLITEVGNGFRAVDPEYDTKNATYRTLAESALAAKEQFMAMFLD